MLDNKLQNFSPCCEVLDGYIDSIGNKGFAVAPLLEDKDEMRFILVGCTEDVVLSNDTGLPPEINPNITKYSTFQIGIRYCPFCGQDLNNVVKRNKEHLKQVYQNYKEYIR